MVESTKDIITFKEYTHDEVLHMRKNGQPRPQDCTWTCWNRPLDLTPNEERICFLLAHGKTFAEVHRQTDVAYGIVRELGNSRNGLLRVKEIQNEVFGGNFQKRVDSMVNDALSTISTIMKDPTASAGVRRGCANDILDRSKGKSIQQIEVRTSKIGELFTKLDELDDKKSDIFDADFKELKKDEIDAWTEENYQEKEGQ